MNDSSLNVPSQKVTTYSMGFTVSLDGTKVLLLEKSRPAFLAGQWIGVGGHIEAGETALEAMVREAKEEADLDPLDWQLVGEVNCPAAPGQSSNTGHVYMFAARADLSQAKTMTEERVQAFTWDEVKHLPLAQTTLQVIDQVFAFANQRPPAPKRPRP